MATTTQGLEKRVSELQEWIAQGKILEAMDEFYHENVSMQENANPPTVGKAANVEREKKFLANVKEWKGYRVIGIGVGDNVTYVESAMEFVAQDGTDVRLEQVTAQRWQDGKIVSERFYYDSVA